MSTTTNVGITHMELAADGGETVFNAAMDLADNTLFVRTGSDAAKPAASKAGRIYLPNNGLYVRRDTGSAWASWGPAYFCTEPISADFAWINQGSASVITTNGGFHLKDTGAGAGTQLRIREKVAPSPPYSVIAHFLPMVAHKAGLRCGLCWRESGTGEIATAHFSDNDLHFGKFDSPTVFNADYNTIPVVEFNGMWIKIADDNTNRIISIGRDPYNFCVVHTVSRTDFLTANRIGVFVDSSNAATPNIDCGMTLVHWAEGS